MADIQSMFNTRSLAVAKRPHVPHVIEYFAKSLKSLKMAPSIDQNFVQFKQYGQMVHDSVFCNKQLLERGAPWRRGE